MEILTGEQLTGELKKLPGWELKDGMLERRLQFQDFVHAMRFVVHVADFAEEAQHHPDIDIRYNKVRLAVVTHDAGGITRKDTALAARINDVTPAKDV